MKKRVLLVLLLGCLAWGQTGQQPDQNTVTWGLNGYASGSAQKFPDSRGTITNQFEVLVKGTAPASLTITIVGCMRGGTCSSTLASSSGTSSQLLAPAPSNIYDFYQVTTSWTGGDSTTQFVVNRTGTVAKLSGSPSGSASGDLGGSYPNPTVVSVAHVSSGVLPAANGGTANITTAGQGYTFLPFDLAMNLNSVATTAAPSTNAVVCFQVKLLEMTTFTKVGMSVSTTSNGNHYYIGIYSGDGTTLLRQATFTLGAGTGNLSTTVPSTTLAAGAYWECWGADNTVAILIAAISPQTAAFNVFNQNTVRLGSSSNSISAGVMPSSIGTITGSNSAPPLVMLEP